MEFDEISYRLFRQQLGKEVFKISVPFEGKELGLCLSGGVDSGVLCAVYSKQRPDLRTYSIGFKDTNEFALAKKVAEKFRTNHKQIEVNRDEYISDCKEIVKLKGEPLQVPNEALIYRITKEFKKDIGEKEGVLLLGEGGDEFFGGYTKILATIPSKEGRLRDNYLDRIVYDKKLWKILPTETKDKFKKFFKTNLNQSRYDIVQSWLISYHYPALLQRARVVELVDGIKLNLPYKEDILVWFSQAMPKTMRVNKTFLRVVFGELLPEETLEQEKIGFALPIDINKWQDWNLEVWKNGDSKIYFWKD